jgi:adenylate cyclase
MPTRNLLEFLHRHRALMQIAFVTVITATYWWLTQYESTGLRGFENYILGLRLETRPPVPPPPEIVIISIQASSYHPDLHWSAEELAKAPELAYMDSNWPWNRKLWASLTTKLLDAGARVVAYDMVFDGDPGGNAEFSEVLKEHPDRVVIAARIGSSVAGRNQTMNAPDESLVPETRSNIVGIDNFIEDSDGLVRSTRNYYSQSPASLVDWHEFSKLAKPRKTEISSLSWLAATKAAGTPPLFDHPNEPLLLNFYGSADDSEDPTGNIKNIPLENVFLKWNEPALAGGFDHGDYFKDKVVLVGTCEEVPFNEYYDTPLDYKFGVEIQADAVGNLLHGDWLTFAPDWVVLSLALGLAAMALVVSLGVHAVIVKMGLFLSLGAIFFEVTQRLFVSHLYVTPVSGAIFILAGCGVFGTLYDYLLERYERRRMLGAFESMVSPGVVNLVLNNRDDFEKRLGGQRRGVATFFSDIRGFTSWSERVGPDAVVAQLNEYFYEMVDIVQNRGGTVQRYIGDSLMAAWGDVRDQPAIECATQSVWAGLQMVESLKKLNAGWVGRPNREQLAFGIGITYGEGIVGYVGNPRKMEFTVMGDTVNLAARLESATKQYRQVILVGERIHELTKEKFYYRLVDKMQVIGKTLAVPVYAPMGPRTDPSPPGLVEYEAAIEKYYAREFVIAVELFRAAQAKFGGADFLCENFLERCRFYLAQPPPADWNGAWVLKEK